jgi:hypothetical protein
VDVHQYVPNDDRKTVERMEIRETHHCRVRHARINVSDRAEAKQICAVLMMNEFRVSSLIYCPLALRIDGVVRTAESLKTKDVDAYCVP